MDLVPGFLGLMDGHWSELKLRSREWSVTILSKYTSSAELMKSVYRLCIHPKYDGRSGFNPDQVTQKLKLVAIASHLGVLCYGKSIPTNVYSGYLIQ